MGGVMSDPWAAPPTQEELGGGQDAWAAPPTQAELGQGPGMLESLGRGALQGGTLGFSDEIAGGIEAAMDKIRGGHEDIGKLYVKHRDESRANNAAAEQANPIAYGGGKLAGTLAPALLTGGASVPEQLLAGGALGAASGLGEANELDKDALAKAALGAAGGVAGAGIGGALAKGAGALATPVAEAAEGLGAKLANPALQQAVDSVSKKVALGALGAGHFVPGLHAVAAGAAAVPGVVRAAGKVLPSLAKTLGRVGAAATKNPGLLGNYGAKLAAASQAGPAAFNAMHFSLAQTDPEYQKKVLEVQNEHPELDDDS
jgi:hypothetical protein